MICPILQRGSYLVQRMMENIAVVNWLLNVFLDVRSSSQRLDKIILLAIK